jgi:CubicO group peptidase (beta-lactamase class C family)
LVVVAVILGAVVWLLVAPPELLRVGDGYAAKIVCSNVFLAHRSAPQVLAQDVQAPGNPVLRLVGADVDQTAGTVTAHMLGFIAPMTALYRAGLGCTLVPDGKVDALRQQAVAMPTVAAGTGPWPAGGEVAAGDPKLLAILKDDALAGPDARAIVVVRAGKIVAERYAPGFGPDTPLIGWSMSKSINAILLGMVMKAGGISFDDSGLFPQWARDGRKDIKLRHLLDMTSGLAFNEDYGDVTDVTRMLYLEPDMAGFAANHPLIHPPGSTFSYSTGTAMMLSRIWMSRLPDEATALSYPRMALFGPLGMTTATFEPDEAGTLTGGSYVYASARDWARVGQFLLQDGVWNDEHLLPDGYVQMMRTGNGGPDGYSQLQTWLRGPTEENGKTYGLPTDTYWFIGHDGQSMAVVPSAGVVVVRMGLTPSGLGWGPEPMLKQLLAAMG